MKLFIQIPCLNEEKTLPDVLETIPKKIDGIDSIDILIIDDGSTDKTVEIAKKHGVKHFVTHKQNQGLAKSFADGLDYCLAHGADIIVNTDGDNQYPQKDIDRLVRPVLEGKADIVVADRQTDKISHFSSLKKFFQKFGSWVVNKAAGTNLPDAASGFRAYSKEAALRINVITTFSYCMETIIHAGNKRIPITSIKITTNPKMRESRLFKSMWQHMYKSGIAIVRSFTMHRPYVVFINLGLIFLVAGLVPFVRYAIIYISGDRGQHIQSLILGAILIFASIVSLALGVIADLIRANRILTEDTLERVKRLEIQNKDK
ncbi:MAG TPA: glycosyltransferase family 2 protein [Candidatus Saccharimonadales bacterium]|nr:glycosyltransferase family 2 protein [Candidatus Saccharimonadales bacterium]